MNFFRLRSRRVITALPLGLTAALLGLASLACSDNLLEFGASNTAEEAAIDLDHNHPEASIELGLGALGSRFRSLYDSLDAAVESDSTLSVVSAMTAEINQLMVSGDKVRLGELISILASARAQLAGVEPLDIALALADNTSSASSNSSGLSQLFPVLPEATSSNIDGLSGALAILDALPNPSSADLFKKALFLTANVALLAKELDTEGDGTITVEDVAKLTPAEARVFLNLLIEAASTVASSEEILVGSKAAASSNQITAIEAAILKSPGSTDTAKVQNYLSQSSKYK